MVDVDEQMVCPGCGAPVSLHDKICEYCGRKLTFTSADFKALRKSSFKESSKFLASYKEALKHSPDNPEVLSSLGFLLLDKGRYEEAGDMFSKAIEHGSDDSEVMFHAALARYKSKKAFQISVQDAKGILGILDSAISLQPLPQYYYVKAFFVKNLFEKKYLKYSESSTQLMELANQSGLSESDRKDVDVLLAAT